MNHNNFKLQDYTVSLYTSTEDLPQNWDTLAAQKDILLSTNYLKAIEIASPKGMKLTFVAFSKGADLVALAVFQYYTIKGREAFRPKKKSGVCVNQTSYYAKKIASYPLNFKVLTAGNLMLTGEHAYCLDTSKITQEEFFPLWLETTKRLKKSLRSQIVLVKDFYIKALHPFSAFKEAYIPFEVEPNMVLTMRESWTDFQSYTDSMEKKYRARVRAARKKAENLVKKALTLEEVAQNQAAIYALYKSVSDNATFNTFVLPEAYFYEMKKHLGEAFSVIAYYQEEKMVGFFTLFKNNDELDAHFLGYCPALNRDCQLYFNMLLDMVAIGIYEPFKRVVFGRTAVEIKSTVGAEAFDMRCFLSLKNPVLHQMARPAINYFKPNTQFVYRSPFKEQ